MKRLELVNTIRDIVEKNLEEGASLCIVDILISGNAGKQKIKVLMDGEDGISIDQCAKISRKLGAELEENDLVDSAYVLEVSSPGVDYPLVSKRQYEKNLGRLIQVTLNDEKVLKGKIESVNEEGLALFLEKKRGKIIQYEKEAFKVRFEDIRKSNVLISFK